MMNARVIAWICALLSQFLNVIGSTSPVSLALNDENLKSADLTGRFKRFASTYPLKAKYIHAPVLVQSKRRFQRQADSEFLASTESMTKKNTPFEQNDGSERYTLANRGLEEYKNTVIPLLTSYNPEPKTTKETYKVTPVLTTDEFNDVKELEHTDVGTTSSEVDKNHIQSSAVITQGNEFGTATTQPIALANETYNVESNILSVVGITEVKKRAERIMTLPPQNDNIERGLNAITNLLQRTTLKLETESYVLQLHERYGNLPIEQADIPLWTKFSRAVVEYFVLEFCRNYPNYTTTERSIARWYKVEEYREIYNMTLLKLQKKKGDTGLQFAAPVRRAADIYKAILDTSIGIVQSKCVPGVSHWMCSAEYAVRLADMSKTCENVWHHAEVHLTVLESIRKSKSGKDPASEIIDELDERLKAIETNNDADFLFNFIIETLGDLVDKLRESLLTQASLYSLVRNLQNANKLTCLNIDEQQW